jgi:Raf kinase inhibitor-like YbhB/YbcL family protein
MNGRVARFYGCGLILCTLAAGLLVGCAGPVQPAQAPDPVGPAATSVGGVTMKLTSSAFADGAMIPVKYTCDGKDISPPLAWADVPGGAAALALICDDPDAPAGTWVHWVAFNLAPGAGSLPEGAPADKTLKTGGVQGANSWRRTGYGGPCPPSGTHRYFFKLYALDSPLSLSSSATAKEVQAAMKGHILDEAKLMGRYKR